MSDLLRRVGDAFVAPQERAAVIGEAVPAVVVAPAVAVLCRPEHRWAAGGAVALAARGAGASLVAAWTAGPAALPGVLAPASPAARRLRRRLVTRGHAVRATGRLVLLALDADPAVAAVEAVRAAAATTGPVVLALAGPRDRALDALLAAQDRVVVARGAGDEDAVCALALHGLARAGHRAEELVLPRGPVPRALAAAGLR